MSLTPDPVPEHHNSRTEDWDVMTDLTCDCGWTLVLCFVNTEQFVSKVIGNILVHHKTTASNPALNLVAPTLPKVS